MTPTPKEVKKEHFRKEKSEIITYYPLVGDSLISSVKDIIVKDITDKVEGKEQLIFLLLRKRGFLFNWG